MSHLGKSGRIFWRLMVLTGLTVLSVIPVQSPASAQDPAGPAWVVRTIHTGEFGAAEAEGLAFAPPTNTFIVLDGSGTSTLITMDEHSAGTRALLEAQGNAVNAAFNPNKGSLFVLNHGKGEIAEVKSDEKGLPNPSVPLVRSDIRAFGIKDPQGMTFDPANGRLFVLDAGKAQIVSVVPHPTLGFDANEAIRSTKVERIPLENLGTGAFRGIAFNPSNGHLYVSQPDQNSLYELTQAGELVSTSDLGSLEVDNVTSMAFAPSGDNTDDPNTNSLYILDRGKIATSSQETAPSDSQIVELSLAPAAALPPGTTLLPTTLVHVIDTSNSPTGWDPSAPDTTGIDYMPQTERLVIADSEVDEMPAYWQGKNVFQSTLSGTLISTCTTFPFTPEPQGPFTREPTGLAINPSNNHIFFSDDGDDLIFEVSLGADGDYCTGDDTVTTTDFASLYGVLDAEDVAYGDNTIFVAGGSAAEVYRVPLGANGVLGGGDDGPMTHFDTASLGFNILEGLGYNADSGTLLILSSKTGDKYLGETTTSGDLLRAYDLAAYTTLTHREDVTFAPGSQDPSIKNLYITDRGVDNNNDPNENDGEVYEINIGNQPTATPTDTVTPGPSPTPTDTPTPTNTPFVPDEIFADGFESGSLSAWTSNSNDGGDLSVSAAAALADTLGMEALIDDNNSIFVTDDTPNAEPRYRARFYFDPNSIPMASGDNHYIFQGYTGTSTVVLRVQFRFSSGNYQVRAALRNDSSTWTNSAWLTISDASHWIEIDWRAAANNGGLTLWIDDVERANLSGIDNDTRKIDRVQLGAVSGIDSGTRGTYYIDDFESRRQTYIGPVDPGSLPTPTNTPEPGPSPTPTNTPAFSDLIFADGFESGNFSTWTSNTNDGGDLSVSASAALVGTNGLQAVIDDNNAIYLTDDTPNAEPRYRARFYFDPNSIPMASGDNHFILQGYSGTSTLIMRVQFRFSNGAYQVRAALRNDASTWTNSAWLTISDVSHFIELDWRAASAGANNGGLTLWIDNVERANLSGIDNDTRKIDRVQLGAVNGIDSGTRGTYYIDDFESRRQTYIGP
jgi:uncharacterized protein YjiK